MCRSQDSCYLVLNGSESCSRRNARSDLNGYVVTGSALRGVDLMTTDFCVMALNVADEW